MASLLKIPRNAVVFHRAPRQARVASTLPLRHGRDSPASRSASPSPRPRPRRPWAERFPADVNQTDQRGHGPRGADRCAACLVCVRTCPYGVPQINRDNVSEINEALCQGCGTCASDSGQVIQVAHFEATQLELR